ncbi:hypothetical protein GGS26DRAFT_377023 [Hypomontagnella submonticulosa]|nr:hypothetical protein GGS26DRAFT_377023 [Hypomontagnella submonticulosa]
MESAALRLVWSIQFASSLLWLKFAMLDPSRKACETEVCCYCMSFFPVFITPYMHRDEIERNRISYRKVAFFKKVGRHVCITRTRRIAYYL